ncbi:hypothetical protein BDV23DRAFT_185562 [Aspergillus alliaceus]|uniref:Methyltransferase domain-containing protein n=1 Tax=Petromyces alliaceus TaxID=209559 RepID=A0A5N7C280_PETAA|nr:hypothetical protein BDV23DRAFT_185562 [Aspergillus alliaceus]
MASFLSKSFAHKGYAAFRPTYAAELYRTVLAYHEGFSDSRRSLSVDLGTGHGLVTRELSPHFHRVIGTDPSAGMVSQARELSPQPGRGIVQDKLRAVEPPLTEWAETQRVEYEPATAGVKRGQGEDDTRSDGGVHPYLELVPPVAAAVPQCASTGTLWGRGG